MAANFSPKNWNIQVFDRLWEEGSLSASNYGFVSASRFLGAKDSVFSFSFSLCHNFNSVDNCSNIWVSIPISNGFKAAFLWLYF